MESASVFDDMEMEERERALIENEYLSKMKKERHPRMFKCYRDPDRISYVRTCIGYRGPAYCTGVSAQAMTLPRILTHTKKLGCGLELVLSTSIAAVLYL